MVGRCVRSMLAGFTTTASGFVLLASTGCSAAPESGNVDNVTATAADGTHTEAFSFCNPITHCAAGTNCGSIPNGCGGVVNCGTVGSNGSAIKPDGHIAQACTNSPMDGVCVSNVCQQTACSAQGYFRVDAIRHAVQNPNDYDAYTRAFPNNSGDPELAAYESRIYGIASTNAYEYLIDNVITPCANNPQGEECRTAAWSQIYLVGLMDSAYAGYDTKPPFAWEGTRSPWNPNIPTTKPAESGLLTSSEWTSLVAIATDPKNKFPNSPPTAAGNTINSYYKECVVVFAKGTNTPLNWFAAVEAHDPKGPNW